MRMNVMKNAAAGARPLHHLRGAQFPLRATTTLTFRRELAPQINAPGPGPHEKLFHFQVRTFATGQTGAPTSSSASPSPSTAPRSDGGGKKKSTRGKLSGGSHQVDSFLPRKATSLSAVQSFLETQEAIRAETDEQTRNRLGAKADRDWTEKWGRGPFKLVAFAWLGGSSAAVLVGGWSVMHLLPPAVFAYLGVRDMHSHRTMQRNFPALVHIRYFLESIRPEIRQYFVESDHEMTPFARKHRSLIYQRAKTRGESNPFGTLNDIYANGYEWVNHSNLGARHLDVNKIGRTLIGANSGAKDDYEIEVYDASRLNISGMSYGALSHAAVQALNKGAKMGGFYHNTGEGSISDHHRLYGADVVWNVGTGYFGCRDKATGRWSQEKFLDSLDMKRKMLNNRDHQLVSSDKWYVCTGSMSCEKRSSAVVGYSRKASIPAWMIGRPQSALQPSTWHDRIRRIPTTIDLLTGWSSDTRLHAGRAHDRAEAVAGRKTGPRRDHAGREAHRRDREHPRRGNGQRLRLTPVARRICGPAWIGSVFDEVASAFEAAHWV
mmetsp:Transcript_25080/g.63077  ORF Transcript_25080/g.63077 Transcript_25080/m.63077 type:complete len:549 (+) Transcript_25080:287-1933(+)